MSPPRLNHPDFRVAEIVHNIFEEIGCGNEIGIEDCDEIAGGDLQAVLQSACLETMTVRAVNMINIEAKRLMFRHTGGGDLDGAVRRIIENLNLEKLARIANIACRLDEPLDHVHFVVNRKLYRY